MCPINDIILDADGNELSFRTDNLLRKAEVKIKLEKEHIEEIIKCKNDIIYFAETYIKIQDPNKGLSLIKLYDYQKDILKSYIENRFNINMASRQCGKSLIFSIFCCWYVIFNNDKNIAILANKESIASKLFAAILDIYRQLPQFIKPGVYEYNKSTISLDNGSKIITAATSKTAIRSWTIHVCIIDEAAFIQVPWDDFYMSVYPVISAVKDSKIIIVSTPNGLNHFYILWQNALAKKNSFNPYLVTWDRVPGRDEAWKQETIANTSLETFQQEQECQFLTTHNGVFSNEILKRINVKQPIQIEYDGSLKIWEYPNKKSIYFMTIDPAEGVGKDYSVFNLFKAEDNKILQTAAYRNNSIDPVVFSKIAMLVSQQYNNAMIVLENNSIGKTIANTFINVLFYDYLWSNNTKEFGIRMNNTIKKMGVANLKELLNTEILELYDIDCLTELSNFISKRKTFAAQAGSNDDLVMSLVLVGYFCKTEFFIEYASFNINNAIYKITEDYFVDKIVFPNEQIDMF